MSNRTPQQQSSGASDDLRSPIVKEMRKLDRLLKDIASLKLKQSGGNALQPDQEVKIAREDDLLQSLRTLQEQHPEAAAAFAAIKSEPKTTTSAAGSAVPARESGSIVPDVLECPVDDDMAGACRQQCIEFDCRTRSGALLLKPVPRIQPVPLIFMRNTHYIGRYDGEGIDFACPRLVVELPKRSAATPALLLAALASPMFAGFKDLRFTSELWEMPPTTPAGDFNVMTHSWMFGHLDLAQKLQNHADVIIGAFDPHGIEAAPAASSSAASSNHSSDRNGRGAARAADGDGKHALPLDSVRRMRSNAAFVAIMEQQRHLASIAPDALPGSDSASLHALLSCLHSDPFVSHAAAPLAASLIVADDDAPLCAAEAGAEAAPSNVQLGDTAGGGGNVPPSPVPTPKAIHAAIKALLAVDKTLGIMPLRRMLQQRYGWTVSENGIKKELKILRPVAGGGRPPHPPAPPRPLERTGPTSWDDFRVPPDSGAPALPAPSDFEHQGPVEWREDP